MLVEQGGKILFERAIAGHSTTTPNFLASASGAVNSPLNNEPGTTFTCGPVNFHVFGGIAKRRLKGRGQDPLA